MKNKVYIMGGAQTDFELNWTKEGNTFIIHCDAEGSRGGRFQGC